jgi:hypothetical protein
MKKMFLLIAISMLFLSTTNGQATEDKYIEKVQSMDKILETLYGVISGEKGVKRDWDLFQYLFTQDAKLIPIRKTEEGIIAPQYMSCEDYIQLAGKWLEENGFIEKEIHRVTESFGNLTHVFSTYESYRSEADEKPFMRGLNSIQLLNDGNRWWVVNIYWLGESESNPIPDKYLPK